MMKKLSIIVLATTVAIAPAYAEIHDTPIASPVANHSETADLAFAFEDVDNLQLTAMSEREMKETEGAFSLASVNTSLAVRGALFSGGVAHWQYMGGVAAGDEFSAAGYAFQVGTAAAGGALGGAGAARTGSTAIINYVKQNTSPMAYHITSRLAAAQAFTHQRISEIDNMK